MARNIISNKIRNNIRKKSGNSKTIQAIVDPSGYIYEAVASNRIEGAKVAISSDKYIYTDSFISGITVYDGDKQLAYGSDYTAEYTDAEVSPAHTPICGGQELARTVKLTFNSEPSAYGIEITAKTYAGTLGYYSEGSLADNGEVTPPSNDDKVNASNENEDVDEDEAEGKSRGWIIILVIVLLLAGGAAGFFSLRKRINNKNKLGRSQSRDCPDF